MTDYIKNIDHVIITDETGEYAMSVSDFITKCNIALHTRTDIGNVAYYLKAALDKMPDANIVIRRDFNGYTDKVRTMAKFGFDGEVLPLRVYVEPKNAVASPAAPKTTYPTSFYNTFAYGGGYDDEQLYSGKNDKYRCKDFDTTTDR